MASTKKYEFTVEGRGQFPFDMLRYDACYPRDPESASELARITTEYDRMGWTINLRSHLHAPTVGRWQSFGTRVTEQREVKS